MQNPLQRRLQSDFEKVQTLVSRSGGSLKLVYCTGRPPTVYVIEYHCPGLSKDLSGRISVRNQHQVEITLGADYPFGKPGARMLTPTFNPHVFTHNAICLGVVWNAAETLDTLILRIGALLQLDPMVLDPKSPANTEANLWVQNNRNKIPLGNVNFITQSQRNNRIEWH